MLECARILERMAVSSIKLYVSGSTFPSCRALGNARAELIKHTSV